MHGIFLPSRACLSTHRPVDSLQEVSFVRLPGIVMEVFFWMADWLWCVLWVCGYGGEGQGVLGSLEGWESMCSEDGGEWVLWVREGGRLFS